MLQRNLVWRPIVLALLLQFANSIADPAVAASDDARQLHFARARSDARGSAGTYLSGRVAMLRGDYDFAAGQFLAVLARDLDNLGIARQALLASLLADRPDTVRLAQQVANLEPGNPIAQLVLADAEAAHGAWAAAAQHYTAMSRQGVYAIMQQPLLAWAQFGAGSKDAMRALAHPRGDRDKTGAAFRFQEALMADLADRPADAERLYKAAQADLGVDNFDLARALASLQMRQGRRADALRTLAAGGTGPDFDVSASRLRSGIAQRPIRDTADAIAAIYVAFASLARQQSAPEIGDMMLRLALSLRPNFTMARLDAEQALDSAKHTEAALAMLAPIADDDVLAPTAALRRARLFDRLGRFDEALRVLAHLETSVPDSAEPWAMAGTVLRDQHKDAEAVTAFTRALDLLDKVGRARWSDYYERGLAEEAEQQWPAAEADFLKALKLSPDEPKVLMHLGQAWTERGETPDRARQMLEHAAKLRPDDATVVDSLGWVQLRGGDVPAAVRSLERAVELQPESPTGNQHLGDAYWAAGRTLEAQYQWRFALTLNPGPDDAAHLLARLHDASQPYDRFR